jgi:hypothetical protein
VCESFGQEFNSNTATQFRVGRLIHVSHATRTQMRGDLVMCEFRADHNVRKNCGRILSNIPQVTHVFEIRAGKTKRKVSVGEKTTSTNPCRGGRYACRCTSAPTCASPHRYLSMRGPNSDIDVEKRNAVAHHPSSPTILPS